MLKIKDEIDLKELEKFGYKLGQDTVNVPYWEYGKETTRKDKILKISVNEKDLIFVIVVGKKREVYLKVSARNGFRNYVFDDEEVVKPYIENLIQAGLVEKVSVLKSMNKLTKNIISLIISLSILGLAVANLITLIKIYELTS